MASRLDGKVAFDGLKRVAAARFPRCRTYANRSFKLFGSA